MLAYKAMDKYVESGVHGEVLDFPSVITFGRSLDEARKLLVGALVDMAKTNLIMGEALPHPDPKAADPEADLIEPLLFSDRAEIVQKP